MMAKRHPKKTHGDKDKREQDELSERMRDLILVSTVEERRNPSPGNADPAGEQRRRDDPPSTPEQRAS
jgi:hypothetical protein